MENKNKIKICKSCHKYEIAYPDHSYCSVECKIKGAKQIREKFWMKK